MHYKVRFVYNSRVVSRQVDALLAKKFVKNSVKCHNVKSRTVWCSSDSAPIMYPVCESKTDKSSENNEQFVDVNQANGLNCEVKVTPAVFTTGKQCSNDMVTTISGEECNKGEPWLKERDNCLSDVSLAVKVISHPDEGDKEHIQMEPQRNSRTSRRACVCGFHMMLRRNGNFSLSLACCCICINVSSPRVFFSTECLIVKK